MRLLLRPASYSVSALTEFVPYAGPFSSLRFASQSIFALTKFIGYANAPDPVSSVIRLHALARARLVV
jgi:hypothetical protein